MTAKKVPSLKALEKTCKNLDFHPTDQTILLTSPYPEAAIASSIIAQTLSKMNLLFHISPSHPVMHVNALNELREKFSSSSIIAIGIDFLSKTRIKKGTSYPLLLGGTTESEKNDSLKLGTDITLPAAAFVLAKSLLNPTDYIIQLTAAGSLLSEGMNIPKKGANKNLIELAQKNKIIEERKGFKLFGATFLPLDEALRFSTNPYIKSISGNQETCDKILAEAEIPIQKLRAPISNLSTPQAHRLTSILTMQLDPKIIPLLLGTDFILNLESEKSPIRFLSGLETIGKTAWSQKHLGEFIGVLLGDRGRVLRGLIDHHMAYHKEVIFTIQRLESNLQSDSTTSATTVKLAGAKTEALADIGRIALETDIVDSNRPVALDNDEAYTIVWPSSKLDVKQILRELHSENADIHPSSLQSITIIGNNEVNEVALEKIVLLSSDGAGKK